MKELCLLIMAGVLLWAGFSATKAFIRFFVELHLFMVSRKKLQAVQKRVEESSISSFEGWMKKGDIYFGAGNNQCAIECYRNAIETHPLNKTAPFRLGLALFLDQNYRGIEVEEALREALDKDSDYVDAHFILGQFYLDLGLFSQARSELSCTPDTIDLRAMDFLFQEEDEKGVGASQIQYRKITAGTFTTLMALYFIQFFLIGTMYITGILWILPVNFALLLLQMKLHLSMCENLRVQEESITYQSAFRSIRFRWNEIKNLTRENESRVRIILRDREIRITHHWPNFEDIVRKLKIQLYFQKWRPDSSKKSCG